MQANDTRQPDYGELLSYFLVNPPRHGLIQLGADLRTLVYTPDSRFSGIDTFSYFITDGNTPVIGLVTVIVGAGDANHDGYFDSSDLVTVFQAGQYQDAIIGNSTWEEGDWNGDEESDTADIVLAFQSGYYLAAARPRSRS